MKKLKVKPHNFQKTTKWVRTTDEWYPTFKANERHGDGTDERYNNPLDHPAVHVSMMKLTDGTWRVCVWGADDFGMDFDQPKKKVAKQMFDRVQDFVTVNQLKGWGFIYA